MDRIFNFSAERLARAKGAARGCTLADNVCNCERLDCTGCGFQQGEMERRKRLPFHRNAKGLWEKRVGKREAWT